MLVRFQPGAPVSANSSDRASLLITTFRLVQNLLKLGHGVFDIFGRVRLVSYANAQSQVVHTSGSIFRPPFIFSRKNTGLDYLFFKSRMGWGNFLLWVEKPITSHSETG